VSAGRLLTIYLNDHLAGATAGSALARRALENNRGTELGTVLERVAREIEEDRLDLLRIMRLLDVEPGTLKRAVAVAAERIGRLKFNGRLTGYSPLSRVVEIEGLIMGIEGKKNLWLNLRDGAELGERLGGVDLDRLIERAERQQADLAAHRAAAGRDAFVRERD
jgi:hypothetical protein